MAGRGPGLQRLPGGARRVPAAGRPRATRPCRGCWNGSPPDEVDAVFISHGHPDHCADLNPLLRARALRDDPRAAAGGVRAAGRAGRGAGPGPARACWTTPTRCTSSPPGATSTSGRSVCDPAATALHAQRGRAAGRRRAGARLHRRHRTESRRGGPGPRRRPAAGRGELRESGPRGLAAVPVEREPGRPAGRRGPRRAPAADPPDAGHGFRRPRKPQPARNSTAGPASPPPAWSSTWPEPASPAER